MPTPEEWQKTRPPEFTEKEWEDLREKSMLESIEILFKQFWKLILTFVGLVIIFLMTPYAEKVANWFRNLFNGGT